VRAERIRVGVLALLPMGLGAVGAWFDQRHHLGISVWRSACRTAGLTPASFLGFTLQLLPSAVIGVLLGGLVVQLLGLRPAHRACARSSLAAHFGCLLAMVAGMLLCTLLLPAESMLIVEPLLAIGLSGWLFHRLRPRVARASVTTRTRVPPSA
jgi:hypothetical protein